MLKPIAKPVLIALTMMLMSLSPMVGTTSGTSSAYYDLTLDDGTYIYDGDILHIATDPAVQGGYYAETNVTLDLQGLVVGDSYEFSLMIHDGMGYNVYDQYDNITATGNDHQEIYLVGLQADCDYEADIDVSHWDGTTMMFVGHTTFEIDHDISLPKHFLLGAPVNHSLTTHLFQQLSQLDPLLSLLSTL